MPIINYLKIKNLYHILFVKRISKNKNLKLMISWFIKKHLYYTNDKEFNHEKP